MKYKFKDKVKFKHPFFEDGAGVIDNYNLNEYAIEVTSGLAKDERIWVNEKNIWLI